MTRNTRLIRIFKSLYVRLKLLFYGRIVNHLFDNVRRGQQNQCWCGGDLALFEWHSSYGKCIKCGCYVNKRPVLSEDFKKIYSNDCYWGAFSKWRGMPTLKDRSELYRIDGRLDHWLNLIKKYAPVEGVAIEVGCAPGVLLFELQRRGYRCVGVEVEDKVAEWLKTNMHVEMISMIFPDSPLQLPNCDLFLAFDVFEHVPSPVEFLRRAADLLNPGGVVILQTPIDRYDYNPPFGYEVSVIFSDIEHLFVFSDKAMQEIGSRVGLELVSLNDKPWRIGHEICVYRKPNLDLVG